MIITVRVLDLTCHLLYGVNACNKKLPIMILTLPDLTMFDEAFVLRQLQRIKLIHRRPWKSMELCQGI